MDRIIRISLGLFMVILVVFLSAFCYQVVTERMYLSSLSSTYSYTCTITTDSPLSNVTLFFTGAGRSFGQFTGRSTIQCTGDWRAS